MKRQTVNECKMSFPSLSRNEGYARAAASAFAAQCDPPVSVAAEIKTAVSEAVTNAIVHGYRDALGTVELVMRLYDDDTLYISVRDKGRGIADVKQAMEPMFSTAPAEEERSGLGFTVMESFMDKVRVKSTLGRGTTVTMEKRLSVRSRQLDKR